MARGKSDVLENDDEGVLDDGTAQEIADTANEAEAEKPKTKGKSKKADVDIESFTSAVQAAVESTGDGEVNEDDVKTVVEAYRELDGQGPKNAARKYIRQSVLDFVQEDNLAAAKVVTVLNEAIGESGSRSSGGTKKVKEPVDPTEAWVNRGVTLTLALGLNGNNKPDGLADDADAQLSTKYNEAWADAVKYHTWVDGGKEGDEPEVSDIVKDAVKLVSGRKVRASSGGGGVRTYSGPTRSIKKHIESAFADVAVGDHLKVADIVNHKSDEYGDDKPSAGAVSGALKSERFDLPGIRPDEADAKPYGATKVA